MNNYNCVARLKSVYLELLRRHKQNKLAYYNLGKVVHQKQIEFHKCQKRNKWVFGGNRSGKTECGAVECVYLARGNHPYKTNKPNLSGWVVSLSTQVQRDVAQKKILEYINPDWIEDVVMSSGKKSNLEGGIIDYILIKNVFGGISRIGFKSCDQGREKFQGTSLDFVWFDEEPPYDIYLECKMRVVDRQGVIFGTMTPLKGLSWVYDEIFVNCHDDDEVWCTFMQWEDNPYLDKKEIALIEKSLSQEELETRKFGRFVTNSRGIVYSEFDQNVHVIEPFCVPSEWQDIISIDPGLNNPLSAHWYAVDYDNNVYVVAEHFEAGKDVFYHTERIKEICDKLNWKRRKDGKIDALIDSAANQKTLASMKSVSELFFEQGIVVNTNVNKDLFSGINRVKSYLKNVEGVPKIFIFKNCVNMIREFKTYVWGNDDRPQKKDDHCLDELRYYIMSKPENEKKTIQPKTPAMKYKEKLMRKQKLALLGYKNL